MNVLLVEDNDLDAFVSEIALRRLGSGVSVVRATSATEAIQRASSDDAFLMSSS